MRKGCLGTKEPPQVYMGIKVLHILNPVYVQFMICINIPKFAARHIITLIIFSIFNYGNSTYLYLSNVQNRFY